MLNNIQSVTYLLRRPFLMAMLSIFVGNVIQFFRQWNAGNRRWHSVIFVREIRCIYLFINYINNWEFILFVIHLKSEILQEGFQFKNIWINKKSGTQHSNSKFAAAIYFKFALSQVLQHRTHEPQRSKRAHVQSFLFMGLPRCISVWLTEFEMRVLLKL